MVPGGKIGLALSHYLFRTQTGKDHERVPAEVIAFDTFNFLSRIPFGSLGEVFVGVMIRTLEGRLTSHIPRRLISFVMSGQIGLNLGCSSQRVSLLSGAEEN